VLLFPFNLLFHFCIFTAHTCNLPLQGCKTGAHICGAHYTAAKRARIYAEASAGLKIDRAYMRGALHGCKLTSHICGARCTAVSPSRIYARCVASLGGGGVVLRHGVEVLIVRRVGRAGDADGFDLLWDLQGDCVLLMIFEVNYCSN